MPSPIHGQLLWTELLTRDVARARQFYPAVVPWTTMETDMGSAKYTLCMVGDVPSCGMMTLTEEMAPAQVPAHWMGYIGTDDADATYAAVAAAGGVGLQPPFDVPTVGRLAIVADPSGAAFGLLAPESQQLPPSPAPIGFTSWFELTSNDVAGALKFYGSLFGWTAGAEYDMGEPVGPYHIFQIGGRNAGGMYRTIPEAGPPAWLYYARVASSQSAADATKANGGVVMHGPVEVPGGDQVVICQDPTGAVFAVHEVKG
jgi:predicted enzyme related to lactoylglutathione lyase